MQKEAIHVLLVEDNLAEARLLKELLTDSLVARFEVFHVDRLSEALEQLAVQTFDVILLDLSLPDDKGIETFRHIHAAALQVPIVVLTGLEDELLAAKAMQEGAQDYLTKQFSDSRLIERAIRYAIQRKQGEQERLRLIREQSEARAALLEAEKANQLKLKFLAMISHELRTPLTSIKGFATTLLADDVTWDDDTQRQFIHIIEKEADKLTDLVEQLLDLARLEAGTLRIDLEKHKFDTILNQSLAQLKVLTAAHQLDLNISTDLPLVIADSLRIGQVLSNLVGNAARYSPESTKICIHAYYRDDQFIQIDVCDEGPGIALELRPIVFEAFRQGDDQSARKKGAGLGLAICKGIIEKHHGQIWIQDNPPPGTTFSFTLPVAGQLTPLLEMPLSQGEGF